MDLLVVAGEASGDRHAADVVAALKVRRPGLRFFGMGGERLKAEGVELVHGSHEISVMGITEVLPKLPRILTVLSDLADAARARRPAAALLVDVPDFNLRLAKRLKALGVPVAWYISPMVWAWRPGRVKTIAERVDRMLCILPFEEDFYRGRGSQVAARYVGNPVVEQVPAPADPAHFRRALGLPLEGRLLALLPGSRRSEISRILPTLVAAARRIGEAVVVPVAPGLDRASIEAAFAGVKAWFVEGRAAEVVGASDVAVVASGTATLEAGLMQRPLVVVYRLAPVSYLVGKAMVKLPHFSLVNLLAGRGVVPELLQGAFTPEAVASHVAELWSGPARDVQLKGLEEVRSKLGGPGAAGRAADAVLELL
ncbi:MAG: lipid-A-disaccharide synthase [Myxococcaceae bacterium]|nr:lipid-A-disaccharide synthase [Myxococcaceae bacterium]